MTIVPIREDNAYFGFAKQTAQGSPVAPTLFPRWLDGSKFEFNLKTEEVWEGDGTRHLSQVIKNQQSVKITLNFNPRPVELGFFEAAAFGASSDTVTAAAVNTTFATTTAAGAGSITVQSNTGLTGVGTVILNLSPGTSNEEVATFNLPATGAGPYTLTLASGTLKNAHNTSDTVLSAVTHTLIDTTDGSYYTIEVGLGSLSGGAGPTFRVTDCKVDQIKRSAKAGGILGYEVSWVGIATNLQGSPSTVTHENRQVFLYTQGVWTLNGSTTGDALAVESFDIAQKNNVDTSIQTEQLILAALIFGNLDIDVQASLVMQNSQLTALTYLGGVTGTTDAQTIGAGTLNLVFTQADSFHSVAYNVATLNYIKTEQPAPKKAGKAMKVSVEAKGTSNQLQSAYVLQTMVKNTQTTAY